jgi:outer membrane protein TolC
LSVHIENGSDSDGIARSALIVRNLFWVVTATLLSACTVAHYRRAADKETYAIIQEAEQKVFGHTNAFSIATPYSGRRPEDIPPSELIEDRTRTNRRVLSLSETLDLAVENSREYQAQKEQLYLTALTLTGARYQFTPIFFANSTAQLDGVGSSSLDGGVHNHVGLNQLFRTGGQLGVSVANDLLRYFVGKPAGSPRNSAIDTITVNLAQPLLQGFGRNNPTVENLTQAERNVVYAIRSFSQYQKQFDMNVVNDYFNLLSLKATVRNNYTNYLRRVDLTKYTAARAVDRVREADVEDARTAELAARIGYINSVASYLDALDSLKLRLGVPLTEALFLNDADLRDLERAGLIPVPLTTEAAFRLAVKENLDLLNAIDRFEDSKRKVRIAADQLRPTVNLLANASVASEPPDDYVHFDPNQIRYEAGLSLDNVVDKLPARNNYRATVISFESQLRSLVASLDGLRDRIDHGFRGVEQERQNYLNRQASLDVAARRVDMNQTLLEAGRAQVRDLREAQDALIAAQNQVTDSMVSYLAARLQLLFDIGVLNTSTDHFWLKNPLANPAAKQPLAKPAGTPPPEEELVLPNQVLESTP